MGFCLKLHQPDVCTRSTEMNFSVLQKVGFLLLYQKIHSLIAEFHGGDNQIEFFGSSVFTNQVYFDSQHLKL